MKHTQQTTATGEKGAKVKKWVRLRDMSAILAQRGFNMGLPPRRQPYDGENDDYGVNPKRPKPPRVRVPDNRDREVDRADDRDQEDRPDRDDDE